MSLAAAGDKGGKIAWICSDQFNLNVYIAYYFDLLLRMMRRFNRGESLGWL